MTATQVDQSPYPLQIVRAGPMFAGVPAATFERMTQDLTLERWPRHAAILSAVQTSQRFILLAQGRVKIVRANGSSGRELTLWLLGPGDGFDVVAALDGQPHQVSAWAIDEVVGYAAPIEWVRHWLERDGPFRRALHHYAASQLRALSDLAADLALHDTATRLARLLVRYCSSAERSAAQPTFIDDLSHEELAAMIGSVRVVINRLLGKLKREAIVDREHGRLQILDMERLLQLAESRLEHCRHAANG